jgi:hypothetical protein
MSYLQKFRDLTSYFLSTLTYNYCQDLLKRIEDRKLDAINNYIINKDNQEYVSNSIQIAIAPHIQTNDKEHCELIDTTQIDDMILKYANEFKNLKKIKNAPSANIPSVNSPRGNRRTSVSSQNNLKNSNSEYRQLTKKKQINSMKLNTNMFQNPYKNMGDASICIDYIPNIIDELTNNVLDKINNLEALDDPMINIYINSSEMENSIPFFYTLVCKLLYNKDPKLTELVLRSINEINIMFKKGITRKIWEGVQKILYYQSIINNIIISEMLSIPDLKQHDIKSLIILLKFIQTYKLNLKKSYNDKFDEFIGKN